MVSVQMRVMQDFDTNPVDQFQLAKARAAADPVGNKAERVKNLMQLEQKASELAGKGASPDQIGQFINEGRLAITSTYPDIPEYEKAVSAAGQFKRLRAADDPQEVLNVMPY